MPTYKYVNPETEYIEAIVAELQAELDADTATSTETADTADEWLL